MTRRSALLQLGFLFVLPGCLAPELIPISYISGSGGLTLSPSSDYRVQTAAIASELVTELRLPNFQGVLYVYSSLDEFKVGFVKEGDAGGSTDLNNEAEAVTACKSKKILAYWSSRVPFAMRVKLLAHEMTHLAHFALGNWSCSRREHAWLMEGFANWMAFRTIERLSVTTFNAEREDFLNGIRAFRSKQEFPSLKLLSTYEDWLKMRQAYGYSGTYQPSFFAVDYLFQRNGLDSIVKYFTLFQHSADADSNFKSAFGLELADFERDFSNYLATLSGY
jgi:hypothetical protein